MPEVLLNISGSTNKAVDVNQIRLIEIYVSLYFHYYGREDLTSKAICKTILDYLTEVTKNEDDK